MSISELFLPGWGVNLALTVVSVILGIVCMVNPFHTALALARMLGVALLLYAVMEAVGYAQLRKVGRAVEDAVNRTAPIIEIIDKCIRFSAFLLDKDFVL